MSPTSPVEPPLLRRSWSFDRWLRFVLLMLVASPVVLVIGFYVEEKIRGRAAWRAYEAAATQRGVKLDFADFIPPKIPDAENFASIPIFDEVFRLSDKGQETVDPFQFPTEEPPPLSDVRRQQLADLAAWQKYFVETKLLPTAGDNAAADVLQALEHYAAPLAELRAGALRPHCRFPVHWEKGASTPLPHLGLIKNAAKLCALRCTAHLDLGQSAAAYEDFHDGLLLSAAITDEPAIISGLVRLASVIVMQNAVWAGLARQQWAEPELHKIADNLAALDWFRAYLFSMGSERGATNLIINQLYEKPQDLFAVASMGDHPLPSNSWVMPLYPSGWFDQSKVRMNHFYDELLARIDPAQRRFFGERTIPSSPKNTTTLPAKIRWMPFMLIAPVMEDIEAHFVLAATMTDLARLACALERCRLARGAFPKALSELVPEFLPALPAEIVNGEPYRYRRTDDGSFVLYSVGLDLRDDGGVIDPKKSAKEQADWVWRYPTK